MSEHEERARLIVDEAIALGWDPVRALLMTAAVAAELGRPDDAHAMQSAAQQLASHTKGNDK